MVTGPSIQKESRSPDQGKSDPPPRRALPPLQIYYSSSAPPLTREDYHERKVRIGWQNHDVGL